MAVLPSQHSEDGVKPDERVGANKGRWVDEWHVRHAWRLPGDKKVRLQERNVKQGGGRPPPRRGGGA